MSEAERLVTFHLLGQEFTFYTGASEEEMQAILALVKKQIENNGGRAGGTIPAGKVVVMACLNLASHYLRLKQDYDGYRRNTEDTLATLNEKLEMFLAADEHR